jgi:hypothetical protein
MHLAQESRREACIGFDAMEIPLLRLHQQFVLCLIHFAFPAYSLEIAEHAAV